ncbi:hypothetical protein Taro_029127 [Colocasia esculenta]|uniref:Uncharacterized protein n=1 Tax=Colocasia esculenta TaxID=4460 RepID=A0A843VI69_COLES|nr:hypothetical protein [Colocasia esculenta]
MASSRSLLRRLAPSLYGRIGQSHHHRKLLCSATLRDPSPSPAQDEGVHMTENCIRVRSPSLFSSLSVNSFPPLLVVPTELFLDAVLFTEETRTCKACNPSFFVSHLGEDEPSSLQPTT